MKTVAFIAELNPPHLGHAYFVKQIKELFGQDTEIIAIMSGSYVQRGMPAVTDSYTRAEMALHLGVDLVLELPFPYSSSNAERFAKAGVAIAAGLGCVDVLCFGSECGDIQILSDIASVMDQSDFKTNVSDVRKSEQKIGYPELIEMLIGKSLGFEAADIMKHPNNILAVEYLRALHKLAPDILPCTIRRIGDYHSNDNTAEFPSASYIRRLISEQNYHLEELMGKENADLLTRNIESGNYVTDMEALFTYCVSTLLYERRYPRKSLPADCSFDLYHRFLRQIDHASSPDELIRLVRAKHETEASVRRALLYLVLHVKKDSMNDPPAYTRVLALNHIGRSILKNIQKKKTICILTKTADYKKMSSKTAKSQTELAIFADQVYNLCIKERRMISEAIKKSPKIRET